MPRFNCSTDEINFLKTLLSEEQSRISKAHPFNVSTGMPSPTIEKRLYLINELLTKFSRPFDLTNY